MSFLSRNLLCKNIYTMSSFMWSNELFSILKWWLYLYCIFLFSFLIYEASYSKNIKIFRNVEFIFAIGFETVFCGTYSCNWLIQNCILRIKFSRFWAQITKISSTMIYSATIYDQWANKLFANLLKYKENTKVSVGIKFGKGLLTSCVLDSLTSMIACCYSNNTE